MFGAAEFKQLEKGVQSSRRVDEDLKRECRKALLSSDITQVQYLRVLSGEIGLEDARRETLENPSLRHQAVEEYEANESALNAHLCLCGCGNIPNRHGSNFMPGHDSRMEGVWAKWVAGLEEPTERQKEYLRARYVYTPQS